MNDPSAPLAPMPLSVTDTPPATPLLQRAAAGSPDAIAELYHEHGEAVFRTAYRLTGSAADAEDVLQDVFIGLPEALRSYAGRGSFGGWLRRVAARTALMRIRQQSRRGEVGLAPDTELNRDDPSNAVERTAIERALGELPEALRAVFVLKEVEGYSHAEIAELLGIRPGTSAVRRIAGETRG